MAGLKPGDFFGDELQNRSARPQDYAAVNLPNTSRQTGSFASRGGSRRHRRLVVKIHVQIWIICNASAGTKTPDPAGPSTTVPLDIRQQVHAIKVGLKLALVFLLRSSLNGGFRFNPTKKPAARGTQRF